MTHGQAPQHHGVPRIDAVEYPHRQYSALSSSTGLDPQYLAARPYQAGLGVSVTDFAMRWTAPASRANIDDMDERIWDDNDSVAVLDEDEVDSAEIGGLESYTCAFCGEANDLLVDRTVSKNQQFTEDCDVCCRPNLITVQIDPDGVVWINAEQEDEA